MFLFLICLKASHIWLVLLYTGHLFCISEWWGVPRAGYLVQVRVCLLVVVVVGSSSQSSSLPGFFRLTFWSMFHHPKNDIRNRVEKNMWGNAARLFAVRCASCWHSHLSRSTTFWNFYQPTLTSLNIQSTTYMHQQSRVMFFHDKKVPAAST